MIKDYGYFSRQEGQPSDVMRFRNELGHDWYDLQTGKVAGVKKLVELKQNGEFVSSLYPLWAMVDTQGVVTNVETDPSRMVPDGKTVLGISGLTAANVRPGMIYVDRAFRAAPPAPPPPYSISKETPWMRMTDEEAEAVDVAYNAATVRFRQSYNSAVSLRSDTALWDEWRTILVGVLGEPRTDQLLERE